MSLDDDKLPVFKGDSHEMSDFESYTGHSSNVQVGWSKTQIGIVTVMGLLFLAVSASSIALLVIASNKGYKL